ncbi:hypothetical protein CRUP_003733 [Coryphaenoides rupestris]|nr:hypothetical protein CRUP_003733 [Coryphaenoides rupestris]
MKTKHLAKLSELQDLVMRLVAERDDWCSRYTAASGAGPANPDLLPLGQEGGGLPHHHYLGADPQASSSSTATTTTTTPDDGTTRQIMQLLQEIRNPQGVSRAPPFLGDNPCIPFFYRPDEQDEVKILVV